ncbi:MAG: lysophospholipid acyltransferase family protein [Verrucomicrobiae bacterium]
MRREEVRGDDAVPASSRPSEEAEAQVSRPHTERLAYRLGYTSAAFSVLCRVARVVGRRGSRAISLMVAKAYCATQPGVLRVVGRNISLLGHPPADAPQVFENFAATLADYFWLAGRSREEAFALADIEGSALDLKTGAVLASGHFGFFEFGTMALSQLGLPVSIVTDSEPTSELTRWRAAYRRRWGAETIELGSDAFSSLRAVEAIKAGRMTAMLVDRTPGGRLLEVELPGGRVSFSMAPAILSWVTGCPVIPVSVRRTAEGRYALHTGEPVTADRSRPRTEALEECTRAVASALVRDFLRDPLQWYHFVPLS